MLRKSPILLVFGILMLATGSAFATTFIVPDDAELVAKSDAIVTGFVVGAETVEVERGYIETMYEIALERVLKGPFAAHERIRISSPGGIHGDRFTHVESAAHFQIGDDVLLFLTPHRGGWTPTDMVLGKFTFATTSRGYGVLVRDAEDIVGWDRDGKVHHEKIRLEPEFLQFIQDVVAGREPDQERYEVEAGDVLPPPPSAPRNFKPVPNLFPAPSTTYSISFFFCDGERVPGRWTTGEMTTGISYFKNSAQNASGLGDGGVSIIEDGLAAWTDDCESAVNISYGGTTANLKDSGDGVNTIVFNDPGGHIAGSWTGSGTIATAFTSGGGTHAFDSITWISLDDADIVFQNGYAGTEASIEEAMTHEIGHTIGFRHSDKHYEKPCTVGEGCSLTCSPETSCDTDVEECSTNAIMRASVVLGLNFTLQSYDAHAADALYPGSCVVADPPTNVTATATTTSNVLVTWSAAAGADSYNVYRSANGSTYSLAGNTASTSFNDGGRSSNTAYLYKVTTVDGGNESSDSNIDLATTTILSPDPLVPQSTIVAASHMVTLRTAVNAVRALASLGGGSYTDSPAAGVTPIKAIHLTELRSALDAARGALSLAGISYGETITATSTTVKASHFEEIRGGVK